MWICLLATALLALPVIAWQRPPPLSLTVTTDPEVVSTGEMLTLTFTVSNTGESPLDAVAVLVDVPQGTTLEDALAPEGWTVRRPAAGVDGTVEYRARDPLAPDRSAQLVLTVLVGQAPGGALLLDRYTAVAEQISTPVEGEPLTIWVGVTPTPLPTGTATAAPTGTATRPPATPSPSPSPSVTPSATATQTATPTATITVGPAELPPTATPTPNLSPEQVVVGTVTVSIFVVIVVALIVLAVLWIVRSGRQGQKA